MNRKTAIFAMGMAASAAAIGAAARSLNANDAPELVGTRGVDEIARRQREAEATRGRRKVVTRAAVRELQSAERGTIVLQHIHPRWLREAVRVALDDGITVNHDWIEQRRASGPDVCPGDNRPCYVPGSEPHHRCGTVQCGRRNNG